MNRSLGLGKYLLLAVLIVGLSLLSGWFWSKKNGMINPPVTNQVFGTIEVVGTIDCLPHKGNGPSTMECAFGLKAENGSYYGLTDLDQEKMISGEITTGVKVKVSGNLTSDPKSNYDIVGVIEAKEVEVVQ